MVHPTDTPTSPSPTDRNFHRPASSTAATANTEDITQQLTELERRSGGVLSRRDKQQLSCSDTDPSGHMICLASVSRFIFGERTNTNTYKYLGQILSSARKNTPTNTAGHKF